ncbi:MAG: helix-turn-helix domain-containing protein [Clostridiaceae bacterium]|nr:helix-turn-helix domain-containing protein [Clostridiaceae bacterium]
MDNMIRIGEVIKELRTERGLRQTDLAKEIGVAGNTITQYENNTIRPSYEVLVDIANFFNVSTDYLLGLKDF